MLDSLVVFPAVGDVLRAWPAPTLSLTADGPFGEDLGSSADNLVFRAARLLAECAGTGMGARLLLTKNLPVASGLGGGSADAAAALRLLGRLWNLEHVETEREGRVRSSALAPSPGSLRSPTSPAARERCTLPALALALGADVPVCLRSRPARMGGSGEQIEAGPALPPAGIALVNPGEPVATAEVFAARRGAFSPAAHLPAEWHDVAAMAADLATLRNDLQDPAIGLCPAIGDALSALASRQNCLLARMSGSGATCFGLFPTRAAACEAAEQLRMPGWWSWGGALTS